VYGFFSRSIFLTSRNSSGSSVPSSAHHPYRGPLVPFPADRRSNTASRAASFALTFAVPFARVTLQSQGMTTT
jgi:hypothetical protein